MIGATTLTSPSREGRWGAIAATTPVGSGTEKLKYGPATGLLDPRTWAILSDQPAYQTQRSIAASTCVAARREEEPSERSISSSNCARRPSSISAMR